MLPLSVYKLKNNYVYGLRRGLEVIEVQKNYWISVEIQNIYHKCRSSLSWSLIVLQLHVIRADHTRSSKASSIKLCESVPQAFFKLYYH